MSGKGIADRRSGRCGADRAVLSWAPADGVNANHLSKKLACGDLFRQELSECFRASAETPRPPGKAGRYEQNWRGCGPSNTTPSGLSSILE